MEKFNIKLSLTLIKERIKRIEKILKDKENEYFYEVVKLNLIEIGEESKNLNDFLKHKFGKWDKIISKEYNFRISLTHYYSGINNSLIDEHLESDFRKFIEKIKEIENNNLVK